MRMSACALWMAIDHDRGMKIVIMISAYTIKSTLCITSPWIASNCNHGWSSVPPKGATIIVAKILRVSSTIHQYRERSYSYLNIWSMVFTFQVCDHWILISVWRRRAQSKIDLNCIFLCWNQKGPFSLVADNLFRLWQCFIGFVLFKYQYQLMAVERNARTGQFK